jgi:hypothetical protein
MDEITDCIHVYSYLYIYVYICINATHDDVCIRVNEIAL